MTIKKPFLYALAPAALTMFLAVRCIMLLGEQSKSAIFYLWYVLPLCLMLLSGIAYFLKKWKYTLPLVGVVLTVLFVAAGADIVLGMILLAFGLLYYCSGLMYQKAREYQ